MGSRSDASVMRKAAEILDEFDVAHEDQIVSAHRTPARLAEYARHAEESGLEVIIAGAGGAAHLPGMIASYTLVPVIGVPVMTRASAKATKNSALPSPFLGMDALLSISEMPTGSPVVCVGVNKAANAGLYALRILATGSAPLRKRLKDHKDKRRRAVVKESDELRLAGLAEFVSRHSKSTAAR